MPKIRTILLLLLIQVNSIVYAENVDLTGTWESKYSFGPIEEYITADIQQVNDKLLGSYTVKPFMRSEESGIIFGEVDGNVVKANFLLLTGPVIKITFVNAKIGDQNTMKGTYHYADSQKKILSGEFEATRK